MPNLRILAILAAISFSFLVMAPLVWSRKPQVVNGDFQRNILNTRFKSDELFQLNEDASGGIKFFKGNIYINTLSSIIQYNLNGDKLCRFSIPFNSKKGLIIGWSVDTNSIFFEDCRNKVLIRYPNTKTSKFTSISYERPFQRSINLKNNLYMFKGGSSVMQIKLVDFKTLDSTTLDVLPKLEDGGITTDGFFVKSYSGTVSHICYYLNKFQTFDSTGKFLYEAQTIDGEGLSPEVIRYGKAFKPSPDAKVIHKDAFADFKYLYILSNVKSSDLSSEDFDSNTILDVYKLEDGKYKNSYLLPNINGKRVYKITSDTNGKFYAVYGNYMILLKSFN